MKIAVIGSGISGLSAAHFLSKRYKVDLFEKNDHFGGHSYTTEIYLKDSNEKISVDLGFIVFNKINYPNLINLFKPSGQLIFSYGLYGIGIIENNFINGNNIGNFHKIGS